MRKQTVKKGRHFTNWHQRFWRPRWSLEQKILCYFGPDSDYHHKNPDGSTSVHQKSRNKLLGVTFHWLSNHKSTAMIGDRWDIDKQMHELNFYYHGLVPGTYEEADFEKIGNGARSSRQSIFVRKGELFEVTQLINPHRKEVTTQIKVGDQKIINVAKLERVTLPYRLINRYFGGQIVAQRTHFVKKSKPNK